jgi:hypothetical protein
MKRAAHAQVESSRIGEQYLRKPLQDPPGVNGTHQVGLVRNSKVDHHRYMIVVLTIMIMIS